MRSPRQHKVDVAVATCLRLAEPHLLPESILKADAGRMVVQRPTDTEISQAIQYHDENQRLTSVPSETENQWKLNNAGRAWLLEQR